MKSVLFRVDASQQVGLGHLMRCLALAQHLTQQKIQVTFAVKSSSVEFCRSRTDWVGELYIIPEDTNISEPDYLKSYANDNNFDWIVLDGYQFTSSYRKTLSQSCAKLAVFDDKNDTGELYADLVINGANNATFVGYNQTAKSAKLCLGERFRILRTEFTNIKESSWEYRDKLTVSFGGSDPYELTIPFLKALNALNQQQETQVPLRVSVLTGAAYENVDKLRDLLATLSFDVVHVHDSQKVSTLFAQSRLVISAAGGTQFELLACDTPSLLVIVADNQKLATKDAEVQGWCRIFDHQRTTSQVLANETLVLWNDSSLLQEMHKQACAHKNVDGALNVIASMHDS
ncbi:UDP-2,4-diacetamido-2,4,6-trideoxy-beta-L-altropyranose hydrolase [Alteromonadaceae bacterium M269]|nr:UDP-2,4-diacetamido-2,4,6-trideoxy-beta-L-altropyranose hydrolase [Alteromonadaceae bacterium M269]